MRENINAEVYTTMAEKTKADALKDDPDYKASTKETRTGGDTTVDIRWKAEKINLKADVRDRPFSDSSHCRCSNSKPPARGHRAT